MDHPVGSALAKGHIQGISDQFASQMVGHGPADDAATEGVYDHREIEEAHTGRHVGDIGYPERVLGFDREVSADQVRRLPSIFRSRGGTHGSAARYPADSGFAHQASNALQPCADTGLAQFGMDARSTVGTVGALMDQGDPVQQHGIVSGPFRGGPRKPAIVAAGGDFQQAA